MNNTFILTLAILTATNSVIMSIPHINHEKINSYTANLRYALYGLPEGEIKEIEEKVRYQLEHTNLQDILMVNNTINSVLVQHVSEKVALDISRTEKEWGIALNNQNREILQNYYTNQFIEHIGRLSYVEGKNLHSFFGSSRTSHVQKDMFAMQQAQTIAQKLNSSLPAQDINLLQSFIINSIRSTSSPQTNDLLTHTKNGLTQLLNIKLETSKKTLIPIVLNTNKLNNSIESTRAQKSAAINQLLTIDPIAIRHALGSDDYGNDNITEKIIENMDIRCPICFEEFKEELNEGHRCGKPSRIILKAEDKNKSCGHAVCKTCVSGCNNRCPQCRATVDQQDLNHKMNADTARNRRPGHH